MNLVNLHGQIVGFVIIGSWAVIMGWATALRFSSYEETPTFWRAVSVAQVLLGLQFVIGLGLLVLWTLGSGGLPGDGSTFDVVFHFLYGAGFPLLVLGAGHWFAHTKRYDAHTVFAVVGLVNFALAARAWMVGVA